ncbi:PD40 domain-containing protein [Desulfovibrio inopinatus]|uniref:PD40 domain-containing protein n=1 Tax=Desulfovibrio inopinatus TaxID=102109 RepID=UPI000405E084|nr:PD40 domain-containing protein [Desulfovibrio inopinatus]
MSAISRVLRLVVVVCVFMMSSSLAAWSQDGLTVDIYGGGGQSRLSITQAAPMTLEGGRVPAASSKLAKYIDSNLIFLPFLKLIPLSSVPGANVAGATSDAIDFAPFGLAKVDLVLTSGWKPGQNLGTVELRVYESYSKRLIVGKVYENVSEGQLPQVADRFCAALMEALTGKKGFFSANLAVVKPSGKKGSDIWIVQPQGRGLTQITSYGDLGMAISPAWSFDGRRIAYTLIGSVSHYLGVWSGGKRKVYTLPSTSVVSPRFMPNGNIAVSLNLKGKMDIYELTGAMKPGRILAGGPTIDVSPSFDASGRYMAYISDQTGSPQVYLKDSSSGATRRVTRFGYNTNPCISPDGRYIVFTRQSGTHRTYLIDLSTGNERQITFGPGSDENPTFSPDSYFIAFASTRSGKSQIYVTTIHGDTPSHVPTGSGSARMPAWCPTGQ